MGPTTKVEFVVLEAEVGEITNPRDQIHCGRLIWNAI